MAYVNMPRVFVIHIFLGLDITTSLIGLSVTAAPVVICLMYRRHGMGIEKYVKFYWETHFVRNTDRPYQTNNLYVLREEERR